MKGSGNTIGEATISGRKVSDTQVERSADYIRVLKDATSLARTKMLSIVRRLTKTQLLIADPLKKIRINNALWTLRLYVHRVKAACTITQVCFVVAHYVTTNNYVKRERLNDAEVMTHALIINIQKENVKAYQKN